MNNTFPIIVADNQELTHDGFLYILENQPHKQFVLAASCKKELVHLLLQHPCAPVVLDYTLFDFMQEQELINLCARFPQAHVLLASSDLSSAFVRQVILSTANTSLVFKSSPREAIAEAIRTVLRNERYLCPRTQELLKLPEAQRENNPLTKAEEEVLKLLAVGKSSKEIAHIRSLSLHTVVTHRKNIFRKLEVNTAYEATRQAMRMGLVDAVDYQI
jgi:DNA-binding NarL/FixJ family response regulator